MAQVRSHCNKKHQEKDDAVKKGNSSMRQSKICFDSADDFSKTGTFCKSDQIIVAEIIRALEIVSSNDSFASCDSDAALYKKMFPDSAIASGYSQASTKVKYVILYNLVLLHTS